jgi:hypothetical protein
MLTNLYGLFVTPSASFACCSRLRLIDCFLNISRVTDLKFNHPDPEKPGLTNRAQATLALESLPSIKGAQA